MLGSLAVQFGQRDRRARRAARRDRPDGGRRVEALRAGSRGPAEAPDAARARRHPGGGRVRRLHRDLQDAHRRPAPHLHGRDGRAAERARSIPTWCAAWPTRRRSPPATCSTCASARSTTCRRSTSRSSSTCARSSPPTSTSSATTGYNYRVAFVEAFRRRGIYPAEPGRADAGHAAHALRRHAALAGARPSPSFRGRCSEEIRQAVRRRHRRAEALRRTPASTSRTARSCSRRRASSGASCTSSSWAPSRPCRSSRRSWGSIPSRAFEVHELRRRHARRARTAGTSRRSLSR